MTEKNVWLVAEGDPWPDNYIPIMAKSVEECSAMEHNNKVSQFKMFDSKEQALQYAAQLKEKYPAAYIRIFYREGHSQKVKT